MDQQFNNIEDAVTDLMAGKIVILCDDESRENEGDFVVLAEFATPEVINFMITYGRGLVCMPLSQEYASRLDFKPMVTNNTDNYGTLFTVSVDHIDTGTGISAYSRALTIQKILDEKSISADFRRPGHVFPLIARSGGTLQRAGHTEGIIDLANLCHAKPAGVICEIINDDGTMTRGPDLFALANKFNLKIIHMQQIIHYRKCNERIITHESSALLPTKFGDFEIHTYTNIMNSEETVVLSKGDLKAHEKKLPLVRIHSECLTGDGFHSLRCDCVEQLHQALTEIEQYGYGLLIYLRQEGRGIGIINKIKAYALQDNGLDTVEANLKLGFADDARDYVLAAQILKDFNIYEIKLITNNPQKISMLESYNIKVIERIKIGSTYTQDNNTYLKTKQQRMGHLL